MRALTQFIFVDDKKDPVAVVKTDLVSRFSRKISASAPPDGGARIVPTNAIRYAINEHSDEDTAKNFWGGMQDVGTEGALTMNVDEVAADLGLLR